MPGKRGRRCCDGFGGFEAFYGQLVHKARLPCAILRFPGLLAECDSRYASCGMPKARGRWSNKTGPTAFLPKTHFCISSGISAL